MVRSYDFFQGVRILDPDVKCLGHFLDRKKIAIDLFHFSGVIGGFFGKIDNSVYLDSDPIFHD